MALILVCEEDIDQTGSAVTSVRNDRICDIILQHLYPSAWCQIIPLTKTKTDILKMQFGPFCINLKKTLNNLEESLLPRPQ